MKHFLLLKKKKLFNLQDSKIYFFSVENSIFSGEKQKHNKQHLVGISFDKNSQKQLDHRQQQQQRNWIDEKHTTPPLFCK